MPIVILFVGVALGAAGLRWREFFVSASESVWPSAAKNRDLMIKVQTAVSIVMIIFGVVFSLVAAAQ